MRNVFAIKVTGYVPYPITREYIEKASSFAVAINRAVKKYRKDPRIAGHKMNQLTVSAGKASITSPII